MKIKTLIKRLVSNEVLEIGKSVAYYPRNKKIEKKFNIYNDKVIISERKNYLKDSILNYTKTLHVEGAKYYFSEDAMKPTLYASVFACLIRGFYKDISKEEKKEWIEYFNSCQRKKDGLFMDDVVTDDFYLNFRQGYGARHLIGHITIAYDRLEAVPQYEFAFLDEYKKPDDVIKWLSSLDYHRIWGSSNEILNIGTAMQFARDRMGLPFDASIAAMEDYLIKNIRKEYGLWYDGEIKNNSDLYEAIRGVYHIIPILKYDNIDIPSASNCLDLLYKSQNKWGGFDSMIGSSACADIDAIDPLLRLALQENINPDEIKDMLDKAERWIYFNQNDDGGFVFGRKNAFNWEDNENLYSAKQHSNIFATWFRSLSLQLIDNYKNNNNEHRIWTPGMECPLYRE